MIKKLPFWENPEFDSKKRELIKSELLAEFPLLLNFPHYVGSQYSFSFQENFRPEAYTYSFSDGSKEIFELEFQDTHPDGELILEVFATENHVRHVFNVHILEENLFLASSTSLDYSFLERDNEDSDTDGEFAIEDGEDWAQSAPEESLFSYENKRQAEKEETIRNSKYKNLYDSSVSIRNLKVDQIRLERTYPEIYLALEKLLPKYESTMSHTPNINSGQPFERFFLFDKVSKKDLPRILLGEPLTTSDIGVWKAGMFKGNVRSFRNQPIAFIKPNGRILWESRQERYLSGLEFMAILQALFGAHESVINDDELDLVVYDSTANTEGNILIIRSSSNDLVASILKTVNARFGSIAHGLIKTSNIDSGVHKWRNQKFEIKLYSKPDPLFASEFLSALPNLL